MLALFLNFLIKVLRMKKINYYVLSVFVCFYQAIFANNVQVPSRILSEDLLKKIESRNIEEQNITKSHECNKAIQTGAFSDKFPPVFFPYNCHSISAISALEDFIALEDGSIWGVNPSLIQNIASWKESDQLLIYPNSSFFSKYKYVIHNKTLGQTVEVTMTMGPLVNGNFSLRILAINFAKGEVLLQDNSKWTICSSDKYILEKWIVGDYIIVGNSNSWFCPLKNILINVNTYNHVRAQQF